MTGIVRVQELPALRTFIFRAYPEADAPLMADYQMVCTIQLTSDTEAWVHGMLGVSNRRIWRAIVAELLRRGVHTLYAKRAPGRVLPRGETMPDGSLRIDLRALDRRGTDTGFGAL